jgi:hypothetical protein
MSDLAMLAYIVVMITIAAVVHRTFPEPHMPDLTNENRAVALLFFLFFFVTPVLCSWFLADYIWDWAGWGGPPDALERIAQIIGVIVTLFLALRGMTVWLLLTFLAAIGYGIFALGQWIFG